MTLWKSLTAIQHRKLLTRENKKKVVEKFTSISSSLCVDSLKSRVISGQPIFLPRDANFRAKLPSATKSLVTRLFSAFLIRDTFNGLTGKNVI